jgi:hypothetical protein
LPEEAAQVVAVDKGHHDGQAVTVDDRSRTPDCVGMAEFDRELPLLQKSGHDLGSPQRSARLEGNGVR